MRIWAAVLGVALLGACGGDDEEPAEKPAEDDPVEICQELVLDRLRSPSSAEFVDEPVVEADDSLENLLVVVGEVDSQNGFGAQVRSLYECEMIREVDGTIRMQTGKDPLVVTP